MPWCVQWHWVLHRPLVLTEMTRGRPLVAATVHQQPSLTSVFFLDTFHLDDDADKYCLLFSFSLGCTEPVTRPYGESEACVY